jgi:rsbT antagonist protein RsbS
VHCTFRVRCTWEGLMEFVRIPILQIEDYLVASIQTPLRDTQAERFKDDLLDRIYATKAHGLVLDLTAIDVVDSFMARIVGDVAEMAGLMGARVVVSGLQPAVAITLVEFGIELSSVTTALNLERGISALRKLREKERQDG